MTKNEYFVTHRGRHCICDSISREKENGSFEELTYQDIVNLLNNGDEGDKVNFDYKKSYNAWIKKQKQRGESLNLEYKNKENIDKRYSCFKSEITGLFCISDELHKETFCGMDNEYNCRRIINILNQKEDTIRAYKEELNQYKPIIFKTEDGEEITLFERNEYVKFDCGDTDDSN